MNGTPLTVHQSSSRIDSRKLVSITSSPSVAVVSEMAPIWMTASRPRPFSHSISSAGGTMSASCRLARLRHLPSWPSTSHTATSARPASFKAATTFDPINPAPPVTSSIVSPSAGPVRPCCATFALVAQRRQPGGGMRRCQRRGNGEARAKLLVLSCRTGYRRTSNRPEFLEPMNGNTPYRGVAVDAADTRPILIVPYMWIGDFVRGHSVVRVLKQRWPNRPIDLLVTRLVAPLVDYMPGVRSGIVWDLPRSRLAIARQWELAALLRKRNYGTALVMLRTWKAALAPALAG